MYLRLYVHGTVDEGLYCAVAELRGLVEECEREQKPRNSFKIDVVDRRINYAMANEGQGVEISQIGSCVEGFTDISGAELLTELKSRINNCK